MEERPVSIHHREVETARAGGKIRTVRAGRGAAVGVVTESVDVEATLGVGILATDVPGDGGRRRLGALLEDDGTRDLGVPADDSDYSLKLGVSNLLRLLGSSRPMCHRAGAAGESDKAIASPQLNATVSLSLSRTT